MSPQVSCVSVYLSVCEESSDQRARCTRESSSSSIIMRVRVRVSPSWLNVRVPLQATLSVGGTHHPERVRVVSWGENV